MIGKSIKKLIDYLKTCIYIYVNSPNGHLSKWIFLLSRRNRRRSFKLSINIEQQQVSVQESFHCTYSIYSISYIFSIHRTFMIASPFIFNSFSLNTPSAKFLLLGICHTQIVHQFHEHCLTHSASCSRFCSCFCCYCCCCR